MRSLALFLLQPMKVNWATSPNSKNSTEMARGRVDTSGVYQHSRRVDTSGLFAPAISHDPHDLTLAYCVA